MRVVGRVSLLLLSLGGAVCGLAAAEPPAVPDPAAPPAIELRHKEFLESAAVLLSDKEREVFLSLRQDYQRDAFIRRFWQARDPYPQTALNEFQTRWEERSRRVKELYPDVQDDRIRVLLALGEPADKVVSRCSEILLPLEIWVYPPGTELVRGGFTVAFYNPLGSSRGRFRSWVPGDGLMSLLAVEMRVRAPQGLSLGQIAGLCSGGGDVVAGALGSAFDWRQLAGPGGTIPRPSEEWLQTFLSYSTDVPDGAAAFTARLDVSYPGREQSRTVVQGVVAVPRAQVQVQQVGAVRLYGFLIDGEIVRKGELFEHFRYRFTVPESEAARLADGQIPVVFQRRLRPGAYTLIVKVEDVGGRRWFRAERELDVPAVADVPSPGAVAVAQEPGQPPATTPAGDPLAEANAGLRTAAAAARSTSGEETTVRLLPPGDGLLTGRTRIEALTTGVGVARVRFALDGKPLLSKARPPWSVELALGEQPRPHTLSAVALGPAGEELARDELLLNGGPHRFSVRLVEPQRGRTYTSSLRAQAEVAVPEGETLERLELYLNDTLVATLYQPPFVQPILLPAGQALTFVRAVAYLQGGLADEHVVVINAPDLHADVEVDLVELYTSVVDRKGRPVQGIERGEITVKEDGIPQQVNRFEVVRDLPIYAGVLLDTSASMAEELSDAVQGALRFFESVITPKDRAAVITFSDKPTLAARFTGDPEVLAGGVANLTADGNTALYDSLIFSLHYFGGIRGRRALIVLSDGRDEGSRYEFDDALEYARRTGVRIYTVGINLNTRDADVRAKLSRLAEETGGRAFYVERASNLDTVYKAVEEDLRSQYLIAYESTQSGKDREKFRTVEVEVARPGLEAKTLRGYYP
jgi:Ca-activated chloride channel family protein